MLVGYDTVADGHHEKLPFTAHITFIEPSMALSNGPFAGNHHRTYRCAVCEPGGR